ncbi:hypothetical protein KIW84_052921 [Lathyrus oleraceus]|uniref:Uncharacterized protein n=1 Tax=Pisum sativum TaxID=3888 RepID=A0A9D5AI26_PEA|nr:hypothetical protein KIW84_052921 [Pisum sativum]
MLSPRLTPSRTVFALTFKSKPLSGDAPICLTVPISSTRPVKRHWTETALLATVRVQVLEFENPNSLGLLLPRLLDGDTSNSAKVDLARKNVAATFVTAFVNVGFGQAKFMALTLDSPRPGSFKDWVFIHEKHGRTSAVASLGMISLWDVDSELALAQINECFNINDDGYSFAGALLGVGIAKCNIKTDCDPVH